MCHNPGDVADFASYVPSNYPAGTILLGFNEWGL